MILGIDLGTTFSVGSYLDNAKRAVILVNDEGERIIPSVVWFDSEDDKRVVVGSEAKEYSTSDPYASCSFVKRSMGNEKFWFRAPNNVVYGAEEISAMILKRIVEDAETCLGEDAIDGVVITVPAYFNDAQRKATQDAGEIADLNVVGILNEPTAAAIAYCYENEPIDGNVLVYDLGGGTFDITIVNLTNQMRNIKVLGTTGDRHLGGLNFDNKLINCVKDKFEKITKIDMEEDDVAMQDLRLKVEKAKRVLSKNESARIQVICDTTRQTIEVTRAEFDELIRPLVKQTEISMTRAMMEAELEWGDLKKILLVGGSTRIPAIKEMIESVSGIKPSIDLNPDEAVAKGACYYGEYLVSASEDPDTTKPINVIDVNAHSLGVVSIDDTGREIGNIILQKNTPLPASNIERFVTSVAGQTNLNVQVIEGEDRELEYDTIVGGAVIEYPYRDRPAGSPVDIQLNYDTNGIIYITVFDGETGKNLGNIEIERKSNLTAIEVEEKREQMNFMTVE